MILQRLGTPTSGSPTTTWSELDRAVEPDHLTCVYVPRLAAPVGAGLRALPPARPHAARAVPVGPRADPRQRSCRTSSRRRSSSSTRSTRSTPTTRPPTSRRSRSSATCCTRSSSTPRSPSRPGGSRSPTSPPGIHDKLVRRHPHVFGDVEAARRRHRDRQLGRHQARGEGAHVGVRRRRRGRCRRSPTPSTCSARRPRSASTGPTSTAPLRQDRRGARRAARGASPAATTTRDRRRARRPRCSPSSTSPATSTSTPSSRCGRAAAKFRRRFEAVEALAAARGIDLRAADLATLDALWDEVKATEP